LVRSTSVTSTAALRSARAACSPPNPPPMIDDVRAAARARARRR
jgi:hypothetical protein